MFVSVSNNNIFTVYAFFHTRHHFSSLVEVKGAKVNRGADYGLEIPNTYHFYGSKSFVDKLNELVVDIRRDGRL